MGVSTSVNKPLHYVSLSHSSAILIYYMSCRALEVDIGLICVCLLTLPAFLDKHKPKKWNSFLLYVTSYISGIHGSSCDSNNNGPGTPERKDNLAKGDCENLELGMSLPLPAHPRGDMKDYQNNVHSATVRRDKQDLEDIEALSLEEFRLSRL